MTARHGARTNSRAVLCAGVAWGLGLAGPGATRLAGQVADWRFSSPTFVAVSVSDLEASVDWYQRVLGLEIVRELDLPERSVRVRLLRRDDVVFELIAHADPVVVDPALAAQPPFRFLGVFKSGVFVSDIEAFHAWLLSAGVDADAAIGRDEILAYSTFVFRDPDGNTLQAFAPF